MPKYVPTKEDMYIIRPCPICGRDAVDDETCSSICKQMWESFKEDYEFMQLRGLYDD